MKPAEKGMLREYAYQKISERIASGKLLPGAMISELSLARELKISRVPVRDALRWLECEGLVMTRPRAGTMVRILTRRDIVELYELRQILEGAAVQMAVENASDATVQYFQELLGKLREIIVSARNSSLTIGKNQARRYLELDESFHTAILKASGNKRLFDAGKQTKVISTLFRQFRLHTSFSRLIKIHAYHLRIFSAIKRGDSKRAKEHLEKHVAASMAETLRQFETDGNDDFSDFATGSEKSNKRARKWK